MLYPWFARLCLPLSGALLLLFPGTGARGAPSTSSPAWPANPPALGLLQIRPAFSLATSRQLEGLLVQHESLTGERALLVVSPWDKHPPQETAEEWATLLSQAWKLDTTRRGSSVLLVIQESSPGEIELGYRAGAGVPQVQTASEDDLERLSKSLDDSLSSGSWDDIAETTSVWLLQTLNSPLLERPELFYFKEKSRHNSSPTVIEREDARMDSGFARRVAGALAFISTLAALAIVVGSVRQGLRPQVLLGSRRVLRFGLQDKIQRVTRRILQSRHHEKHSFTVEVLEGPQ
ncbi:MAG: hypothetical protein KGQ59_07365 [Bdellovibrionales bacterium]|nr:hypothetical protein [Bdellovibrionales bacterium]